MESFIKKIIIVGLISFLLISPAVLLAQSNVNDVIKDLDNVAGKSKIDTTVTGEDIIGRIINTILGLLAAIFLILVIYGGITWMTAGGSEEKVTKGREIITKAAVGLIIIMLAFLFTNYVVFRVLEINQLPSN